MNRRQIWGDFYLNQAIRELLSKLNHRPFRKRDGSRATVFEALDRPALKPLPTEPFDLSEAERRDFCEI